jgi:hypothetical protein
MNSFHHSRGRVLFEFACALGIVASCVGAWKQTGASALLVSAFVAGLYGFVRLFDLPGRRPAADTQPQRVEFAEDDQVDLQAEQVAGAPVTVADEQQPEMVVAVEKADAVEPEAPPPSSGRKVKAPRKSRTRRSSVPELVMIAEIAPREADEATVAEPLEEVEVVGSELLEEATATEIVRAEEAEAMPEPVDETDEAMPELADETDEATPEFPDDAAHLPVAPLFEPEPFVRQQRAVFGRRHTLR